MSQSGLFISRSTSQNGLYRRRNLFGISCLIFLFSAVIISAQNPAKTAQICGAPLESECKGVPTAIFKPFDLKFTVPEYSTGMQTEEFYAVLLVWQKGHRKNYQCFEIGEDQRVPAQRLFPHNKAFSSNFHCYKLSVHDKFVAYKSTEINDSTHFLAIYGGDSFEKAKSILKIAKKNYPAAKIIKMYEIII